MGKNKVGKDRADQSGRAELKVKVGKKKVGNDKKRNNCARVYSNVWVASRDAINIINMFLVAKFDLSEYFRDPWRIWSLRQDY